MKILEVRDSYIKIESEDNLSIGSFLQIADLDMQYIAQVLTVKNSGNYFTIYAKLLFLYDGTFSNCDNSKPSNSAKVENFPFEILKKSFYSDSPLIAGTVISENSDIILDKNCLNKKMLISIDNAENNNIIVSNLKNQFSKNIVIDMLGVINSPKHTAGVDFKLPLNTKSLEFIFEDCLNDATADSKKLIKEIFNDLSEYSKTVPFLPFGVLKSIIDEMVDKSHVFKLLVLKNKLAKFDKMGYFATTIEEASNLEKIISAKNAVIDISKLDPIFQNRYLNAIYSLLEDTDSSSQVFIEVSNSITKKNLKTILTSGKIATTFVTHSRFKYLAELKNFFNNYIIESTISNNEIFKNYSTFLKELEKNSYLIVGECTNYVPLISPFRELKDIVIPIEELDAEFELEESTEEHQSTNNAANNEVLNSITEPSQPDIIQQKSNELIDKVSEELLSENSDNELNVFEISESSEQEESILLDKNTETTEDFSKTAQETELDMDTTTEKDVEDEVVEYREETVSFTEEDTFHTAVDSIQTIDVTEEISELTEEVEDEYTTSEVENNVEQEIPSEGTLEISDADNIDIILEEDIEVEEISLEQEDENVIIESSQESFVEEDENGFIENTDEEIQEADENAVEILKENDIEVIPINDDIDNLETSEDFIELDISEVEENDIIVEFEDDTENYVDSEDLDKEIIEDVDKVFTTIKEDPISDSDLDFIDELNSEESLEEVSLTEEFEELSELNEDESEDVLLAPIEELNDSDEEGFDEDREILETKNSSQTIVPVYEAEIPQEDLVMSDPIEQGDSVTHAKYGNGVVEKMIKYGAKTLYSINFDNVGRRLLDPTLTEIKKS